MTLKPSVADVALVAETPAEVGAPLFSAETGVLRLALLTNETPSAKARSLGEQIDSATVPQLALYSEVKGLNGQHIEHLWYYEGKLMTRIKLPVKLDYWRTYSRKEFDAGQRVNGGSKSLIHNKICCLVITFITNSIPFVLEAAALLPACLRPSHIGKLCSWVSITCRRAATPITLGIY